MKKTLMVMIIGVVFLACGCGGSKTYTEVDYDTMMSKFEEKDDFILFIGSTNCGHCTLFKVTLEDVIEKYGIDVFYVDVSKLSTEENNKLKTYVNYDGTPTTAFIYDGEERSMYERIEGNQSYDKVVEKLKKQGYIR